MAMQKAVGRLRTIMNSKKKGFAYLKGVEMLIAETQDTISHHFMLIERQGLKKGRKLCVEITREGVLWNVRQAPVMQWGARGGGNNKRKSIYRKFNQLAWKTGIQYPPAAAQMLGRTHPSNSGVRTKVMKSLFGGGKERSNTEHIMKMIIGINLLPTNITDYDKTQVISLEATKKLSDFIKHGRIDLSSIAKVEHRTGSEIIISIGRSNVPEISCMIPLCDRWQKKALKMESGRYLLEKLH
jgi:hypothetical protein